jgi:hypothetical protein
MERQQFDDLARKIGQTTSRRGAMRALLGAAAGGAAALVGMDVSAAPKVKPDCCPTGKPTLCTDRCVDLRADSANCGACGHACSPGQTCSAGTCKTAPPSCNDGVKNGNETDVDCGGTCPKCGNGKNCTANADCVSGACCHGTCVDPQTFQTDLANCGTCGHACSPGQTCVAGVCQNPPPTCIDGIKNGTETDVDCGGSCQPCANGKHCAVNGDCQSGFCTGGMCVADPCQGVHCDDGNTCTNDICQNGNCTHPPRAAGSPCETGVCNGAGTCVSCLSSGDCPPLPGAIGTCQAGQCDYICAAGFDSCDGNMNNGCETNTGADVSNCGTCGHHCTNNNGTATCQGGQCGIQCNAGFGNCDGDVSNGCETNLLSDVNSCGGCGLICSTAHGTGACVNGVCQVQTCAPGFHDCNGIAADGCECLGTSCCAGGTCQTAHSDGVGGTYYDCSPVSTYNSTTAVEACASFTGSAAMCQQVQCGTTDAICSSDHQHCWSYTGFYAGHVSTGISSCPTSFDPTWG